MKTQTLDILLYASIATLGVVVATHDPFTWRDAVSATLAGLIAVKAKRSKGSDDAN